MSAGVVDGVANWEAICIDVLGDAAGHTVYVRAWLVAFGHEKSPERPWKL